MLKQSWAVFAQPCQFHLAGGCGVGKPLFAAVSSVGKALLAPTVMLLYTAPFLTAALATCPLPYSHFSCYGAIKRAATEVR